MNLFAHLPWHRPLPSVRSLPSVMILPEEAVDEDDEPAGCGWFDSSHELQHGLLVTEHASADAVAADLPLEGWIALHLAGWQPLPCDVQ